MDLEFHQLALRYERLRAMRPTQERRLLASLAAGGQKAPILVVADGTGGPYVVIDGYKRIRCLRQLVKDTVLATRLELDEPEALVVSRLWQASDSETALEQAWLLDELQGRFGLTQDHLARRFDRTVSWVSRRLALVRELPDSVQERVRRGDIVAHAAVKYLVPLARANKAACEALVEAIAPARLASRDVERLYVAWRDGTTRTRQRLIEAPLVFLKAIKEAENGPVTEPGPGQRLLNDLELLGGVARRVHKQVREGTVARLIPGEREEIVGCFRQSVVEVERLAKRLDKELEDAGREPTGGHPGTPSSAGTDPGDRPDHAPIAQGGAQGHPGGLDSSAAAGAS